MLDYGWGDNAIVSRDMKKSIQQISADGEEVDPTDQC